MLGSRRRSGAADLDESGSQGPECLDQALRLGVGEISPRLLLEERQQVDHLQRRLEV